MSKKKGKGYTVEFAPPEDVSRELVRQVMPELTQIVAERAREIVPRRTGKLGNSIETRIEEDGAQGAIAATARHAHLVHEGTTRHPLRTTGRAMVVATAAGLLLRRSATHPGTRAQPFLRDALEQSVGEIMQKLTGNEAALEKAVGG